VRRRRTARSCAAMRRGANAGVDAAAFCGGRRPPSRRAGVRKCGRRGRACRIAARARPLATGRFPVSLREGRRPLAARAPARITRLSPCTCSQFCNSKRGCGLCRKRLMKPSSSASKMSLPAKKHGLREFVRDVEAEACAAPKRRRGPILTRRLGMQDPGRWRSGKYSLRSSAHLLFRAASPPRDPSSATIRLRPRPMKITLRY